MLAAKNEVAWRRNRAPYSRSHSLGKAFHGMVAITVDARRTARSIPEPRPILRTSTKWARAADSKLRESRHTSSDRPNIQQIQRFFAGEAIAGVRGCQGEHFRWRSKEVRSKFATQSRTYQMGLSQTSEIRWTNLYNISNRPISTTYSSLPRVGQNFSTHSFQSMQSRGDVPRPNCVLCHKNHVITKKYNNTVVA